MELVKSTSSNKEKCDALKSIGISISNYNVEKGDRQFKKYVISINDMPDADKFIETTFNNINDIFKAFSDRLVNYKVMIA